MQTFTLKALSKEGNSLISFTLKDGPCPLSQQYFGLMNRPGVPYLRYDSIVRCSDYEDICEGDILLSQDKEYIVEYQKGFYAYTLDRKEKVPIDELVNPQIINHAFFSDKFKLPANRPKRIMYKYKDLIFKLQNVYGVSPNGIILNHNKGVVLDPEFIQQCAHISYNGQPLYFGDKVEKRELVLRDGQPVFRVRGRYKTIREMEGVT